MLEAFDRPERAAGACGARSGVSGHREYNTGWHAALDLRNLLTVCEAIARSALERRGEPRRALPRRPSLNGSRVGHPQRAGEPRADGTMQVRRIPIPPMPAELKQIIDEMK